MNSIGFTALILGALLCSPVSAGTRKEDKVKVACIGNSITYGTGIKDREKDSYPVQLQRMLGDGYEVGNFGKPSATLARKGYKPYDKQEEFREAMKFAGDIAVIHLGINDTDPRVWPNYRDDFVEDYMALIDSLRSANRQVRILVARLTPIAHRHHRFISGTKQWHGEIQKAIERVAELAGAELIDFNEPLYPRPDLFPDGLHPNPEGAGLMAKTVYQGITGNYGGLQLPVTYQDYMVVQRNQKLRFCGTADNGDVVNVAFAGQKVKTRANNRGKWEVFLSPVTKAGDDYELTVSTKNKEFTFRHVAVGEVWLCSGQSNMAFMLKQALTAKRDIPLANDPGLRLFDMKGKWNTSATKWPAEVLDSVNSLQYYSYGGWAPCTPDKAADFSAIAYYFGRMLRDSLKVPVGLICNAIGGSPTEAWIDRNTLETKFPAILNNWLKNDFIQDWVRERAALNISNSDNPLARHPYEPCYLYESGIMPLANYPIAGVIWYQGESNAHNFTTHEKLFRLLTDSWRSNWNNRKLPFYFVQLSSLNRPSWTWFRDSQRQLAMQISNTGMAVCSDLGDSLDVHPRSKKPVGERLARWALHDCYGKNITPSGPMMTSISWMDNWIEVRFNYADTLLTSDGQPPRTFEIAEHDGLFYPAECEIVKGGVKLTSPNVKHPKLVRYGWQPFTRANLINSDSLPASTFRFSGQFQIYH